MGRLQGIGRALVVAGAGVSLGGLGFWAGRTVTEPPNDPTQRIVPVTYTVEVGSVHRTLEFVGRADWPKAVPVVATSVGVVTSIDSDSLSALADGAVVMTIDLQPVVVVEGSTPMFRDLAEGTVGPDVAQLQTMLAKHEPGSLEVNGVFDRRTQDAVRLWQRSLGAAPDGVVQAGEVAFIEGLPRRGILAVSIGSHVAPGEPILEVLAGAPVMSFELTREQAALVPADGATTVEAGTTTWPAALGALVDQPDQPNVQWQLQSPNGGPVCSAPCLALDPAATTPLRIRVDVVPNISGPIVPIGAIRSEPAGALVVVTTDGTHLPVTILATVDGLAVVEGVPRGTQIIIPSVMP